MTERGITYWQTIFTSYIKKGREVPPRFRNALYHRLRITIEKTPLLLVGPNGCGKTQLIYHLVKESNHTVRRVNMDGNMTPESFIGATKVRTQTGSDGSITAETYFQLGPVALAVQNGDIIRNKTLSNNMVKLATLCRQAVSNGEMSCWDFSTRRLIAWAKTFTAGFYRTRRGIENC